MKRCRREPSGNANHRRPCWKQENHKRWRARTQSPPRGWEEGTGTRVQPRQVTPQQFPLHPAPRLLCVHPRVGSCTQAPRIPRSPGASSHCVHLLVLFKTGRDQRSSEEASTFTGRPVPKVPPSGDQDGDPPVSSAVAKDWRMHPAPPAVLSRAAALGTPPTPHPLLAATCMRATAAPLGAPPAFSARLPRVVKLNVCFSPTRG